MKNTNRPSFHGSDLEQIEAYYHIKKEDIIRNAEVSELADEQD